MKPLLLDKAAFGLFFAPPMQDVTAGFGRTHEIWAYLAAIPVGDLEGLQPSAGTIDHVYRSGDNIVDHVLIPTSVSNVYLVIVVACATGLIEGHHVLDLNEKYGLAPPASEQTEREAAALCRKYGVAPERPAKWSKVGIALATIELDPLNGVRLAPKDSGCGWFIWGGQEFSQAPDFFQPLHTSHLALRCPRVLRFLSLPPGWRFLLGTHGYEDVWRDDTILETEPRQR